MVEVELAKYLRLELCKHWEGGCQCPESFWSCLQFQVVHLKNSKTEACLNGAAKGAINNKK